MNSITQPSFNNSSTVASISTEAQIKSLQNGGSTAGSKIVEYYLQNQSFSPFVLQQEKLQSASKVFLQDLIGEGPIFGLIDDLGNDLVLFDKSENNDENLKGLYLNDYPVKNSKNNTYNYSRIEIYGKVGSEFQTAIPINRQKALFSYSSPGVIFNYNKGLYNLIKNKNVFPVAREGVYQDARSKIHSTYLCLQNGSNISYIKPPNADANEVFNISGFSDLIFEECFGIYHEIKDVNADFIVLTLKINTLYYVGGDGSMFYNKAHFGIKLGYKQNPDQNIYIYHVVRGIASSPYQFDVVLDVSDFNKNLIPYVKIFSLNNAPDITDTKTFSSIAVSDITEIVNANFKYPNSAYFITGIDSRGFGGLPSRQYNLKLLQVKVPENYDADAKQYTDIWSGEFDPLLRWTDNPAWILYDIITNNRYGLGKFNFPESLADKWSIYQIGKYCDEMVPTFNNSKFPALKILNIGTYNTNDYITLTIPSGTVITPEMFQIGQELQIFNLQFNEIDEDGQVSIINKCFKKRIRSIRTAPTSVELRLFNPFGLHKICSQFASVKTYLLERGVKTSTEALNVLYAEILNDNQSKITDFKNYIFSQKVFSNDEINNYIASSGSAAQKFDTFLDLVEPRFTSNIYLKSETDAINLINNISSIFKGIIYWSNNYIQFDNDSPKGSSYIFNNSNIKNGVFNYSGSSKDTRYTVAKVTYSDASDGFKDKTVYVEDQINIKKYGYVEKDILGFGVTSKSQAKRTGEWFLVTNQIEQELVSFQAGPECLLLAPGNIITISDTLKLTNRYGGRVVKVDGNDIVLDNKCDFIKVNDVLSFIVPKKSLSINELNAKSLQQNGVTEEQINQLNSTYIYKYKVLAVGLDGSFRTKVTLKITGTGDDVNAQENSYTINPSTLWIYEQNSSSTNTLYSKQYRIVGIKENNPVEFEISAIEYVKTKFSYIDNRDNLSNKLLYSDNAANSTIKQPFDILSNLTSGDIQGDDGVVLNKKTIFDFNAQYDYIFSGIDYSDAQIATLFSVITVNVTAILEVASDKYNINLIKGLLIEYILNSKKISIRWKLGDKTTFTIVVPNLEADSTYEFMRAYALGQNDNFL
jgi:hypothetical protein